MSDLEKIARAMVAPHRGILAADESSPTIKKRFDSIKVESTEENRRAYREILFTTPRAEEFISGVILYEETLRQKASDGTPFPKLLESRGILPGIKVDKGTKALAGAPDEKITEGLDGLRERIAEYRGLGARFAKWRAVITIGDGIPSDLCLDANAHALARYAAICVEGGIVPIVEPEVLMDGAHTIERCYEVTERTLRRLYAELYASRVPLEQTILKPNMVLSGTECARQAGVREVAEQTLRCPGGRARDRLPVGRPERRGRDGAPERDEPDRRRALGALVLLRARAPGRAAQGLGRTPREPRRGAARLLPPRPLQRRRAHGLLHARDGAPGGLGSQRICSARLRLAARALRALAARGAARGSGTAGVGLPPACSLGSEGAVAPALVEERLALGREAQRLDAPDVDHVVAGLVGRDHAAVERPERVREQRRARRRRLPGDALEAPLLVPLGREAVRELGLAGGQEVQREDPARRDHRVRVRGLVRADEHERGLERDLRERGHGHAVDALADARGHDRHAGGAAAEQLLQGVGRDRHRTTAGNRGAPPYSGSILSTPYFASSSSSERITSIFFAKRLLGSLWSGTQ
jgi:fructose-bisphosphate aldolase class I